MVSGSGGIVISIIKENIPVHLIPPSSKKKVCRETVPWRVVRVTLTDKTVLQTFACVVFHNYDLNSIQMAEIGVMA